MLPLMELRWMSAPPEGFSNKGINYPAVTHSWDLAAFISLFLCRLNSGIKRRDD